MIARETLAHAYELRCGGMPWKDVGRQIGIDWQRLREALKRAGASMDGQRARKVTPEILGLVRELQEQGRLCWWSIERRTGVSRNTIRSALLRQR